MSDEAPREHPRRPSKRSQIDRLRTRMKTCTDESNFRIMAILQGILDLLEDEL